MIMFLKVVLIYLTGNDIQDVAASGFDNIFNQLYNTFTSSSSNDLIIEIPFTNKSFTINYESVFGSSNLGFIKTLIELFWYYIICLYIVKDIAKKINKIKSGNIEDVEKDNIKEDLL